MIINFHLKKRKYHVTVIHESVGNIWIELIGKYNFYHFNMMYNFFKITMINVSFMFCFFLNIISEIFPFLFYRTFIEPICWLSVINLIKNVLENEFQFVIIVLNMLFLLCKYFLTASVLIYDLWIWIIV